MSFYQNGILISGVNTLPELTRAQYEALPADKRPEYWVCLDEEYEPSSSGHTIQDNSGTDMPQEDNLQFVGLKVIDDSANGKTIVDATDKVTWEANGILGAKNLIPYPYYDDTETDRGITWTNNADGTVTASGTATEDSAHTLSNRTQANGIYLKNGTYTLSGCPSSGSSSTYYLEAVITKNSSAYRLGMDDGNGTTFTISGDDFGNDGAYVMIRGIVKNTITISSNLTFKPMLRLAEDTDNTYQPYAMTNKQLTDKIATKEDTIPFNTFSITASNWTVNSDTSTSTDYPYVYTISSAIYSNASIPIWDLAGAGAVPTSTERTSIDMILEAVFSTSGITLYATDKPTSDLTLRVKGK